MRLLLPLLLSGCLSGCAAKMTGCIISDELLTTPPLPPPPVVINQRQIAHYITDLREHAKILDAKISTIRDTCKRPN